ncbi:squamosa promoter-binding-like protein 1 [Andrographis paniculata]|uniref:squamosa promoter-binding-like protein 1 n=1 Tax=Andrographis paniculata TaxID=175694 RepID=UPI0021E77B33|nr:squamosa promoter-binding-like protein 1 [Andrographis paniculata]
MEAAIGAEAAAAHPLYYASMPSRGAAAAAAAASDLRAVANRTPLEWDPSDWRWDGDLFIATPLNRRSPDCQSIQLFPLETGLTVTSARDSSNSSSSYSDDSSQGLAQYVVRDSERKRRISSVADNNLPDNLTLNLGGGGRGYAIPVNGGGEATATAAPGKKTKLAGAGPNSSRAICQVEDCRADLSKSKDYHRRHKVCEMHSKASKALVGNQMQRFCQQCSRFHALQEFDEGKRSCRRRLAGHNKRRRKTQTDNVSSNIPVNDSQASGYPLMSILKILSTMYSNRSNHTDDYNLLSHLLQSLARQGSSRCERNISEPLQESQNLLDGMPSMGSSGLASMLLSNGKSRQEEVTIPGDEARKDKDSRATSQGPGIMSLTQTSSELYAHRKEISGGRNKMNDFDLNDVYVDSDDGTDEMERSAIPQGSGAVSVGCPSWVQQVSRQSSPRQTSGNSDSPSAQSPSSSSGEAQNYTDRIVFKLFGKEPSDFPIVLRAQIFDWLSNSPTDIESYIKPGCVILTVYLRLSESEWEELSCNLRSSLGRLLNLSDDTPFWNTGWIYTVVQDQIAFIYNGQVVADTSLSLGIDDVILSMKPIAVTSSGRAQFYIKGSNLSRTSTRVLCSLEGNYLEGDTEPMEYGDDLDGHVQCLTFSCSIPAVNGRGFIEVENHGVGSFFFPFIIAEDDVCAEIRMLEEEAEVIGVRDSPRETARYDRRNKAVEFIHELGWLLHRLQLKSRTEGADPNLSFFPFERFKYLVEFSMDREWCSVVNKLLNVFFCGIVSGGEQPQPLLKFALAELGLLHRAVRRNSRILVEMLLRYVPDKVADELCWEYKSIVEERSCLFRPDVSWPGGLTPLHVAAGRDGCEDTLDALIDDPGKVGIGAWKSARDSAGLTPEDYARLRGHYSYIHLVQRKIHRAASSSGHMVVDISDNMGGGNTGSSGFKSNFEIEKSVGIGIGMGMGMKQQHMQVPCSVCAGKLTNSSSSSRAGGGRLLYRPAMLSMLAVAAVCVCVALLFKSSPQVLFVFRPFRWEMLEYGSS